VVAVIGLVVLLRLVGGGGALSGGAVQLLLEERHEPFHPRGFLRGLPGPGRGGRREAAVSATTDVSSCFTRFFRTLLEPDGCRARTARNLPEAASSTYERWAICTTETFAIRPRPPTLVDSRSEVDDQVE
jgi:hypothetical protein